MLFIYITTPSVAVARRLAQRLLRKRLIACANIWPIQSAYWWDGRIERTKECVLLAKTAKKNFAKVSDEVKKAHPYKVPCIARLNVMANREFESWLKKEIG
jgi:periplasmic divalent cation tolerance protein